MTPEETLNQRKNKFLKIGRSKGFISNLENLSSLESKKNTIEKFFNKNKNFFYLLIGLTFLLGTLIISFL